MNQPVFVVRVGVFFLSADPGVRAGEIGDIHDRFITDPFQPFTIFHPGGVEESFRQHTQVTTPLLVPGYEHLWRVGVFRDRLKDRVDRAFQDHHHVVVLACVGAGPHVESFFQRRARCFAGMK